MDHIAVEMNVYFDKNKPVKSTKSNLSLGEYASSASASSWLRRWWSVNRSWALSYLASFLGLALRDHFRGIYGQSAEGKYLKGTICGLVFQDIIHSASELITAATVMLLLWVIATMETTMYAMVSPLHTNISIRSQGKL